MIVPILLLSVAIAQAVATTSADRQRLVGSLMTHYMKAVEPDNTPLKMGVSYICASLNKETHQLTSKLLEKYTWTDNRLTWTPSEFGGITQMRLPASMIWTPDVKVYTAQDETTETRDAVNVVVMSNGTVMWIPMVTYKTYCTPAGHDLHSMPKCRIQIGSWTYDAHTLDLQLDGEGFDTSMYVDTCPYTIEHHKVKVDRIVYPCCPEPYASMHIEFSVTPRK